VAIEQPLPDGMPDWFKVGWRRYKVVAWTHKHARDQHKFAEHDGGGWEIRLDVTYPLGEVANSFIHEALHAMWSVYALEDSDVEERVVTALANGLSAVWLDNPEMLAWLSKALKG
jgi:hypothetical protein